MKNGFDIREFMFKYYQYVAVGVLFIILVVVLAVFAHNHKKNTSDVPTQDSVSTEAAATEDSTAEIPVTTESLKVDAYPDVNALVNSYFSAMAAGDTDTLSTICNTLDDEAKIRITKKAEYTESYDSFKCYTKPGPVANSYIVFAYYQIKFKNIDTKAPGLTSLYVCTNSDGSLYVYNGDMPQNISNYIKAVAAQDDVVALLKQVDEEYTAATDKDKTLKAFMDALPTKLDEAVAAQLASGATASSNTSASSDATAGATEVQVTTTDAVRIRSSADDSSADNVIAKAAKGDTFTRVGEEGNWSKIKYKDTTAYIRSDYLTTADASAAAADTATDTQAAANTDTNTDTAAADTTTKASGKVTISGGGGVKIRSSTSTDSDGNILGREYKGATFDLLGETSDGWYKISYNGKTGYVKKDYATKN